MKHSFFWKRLRLTTMLYFLLVVPALLLSGCGDDQDWDKALQQTAPASPQTFTEVKKSDQTKSESIQAQESEQSETAQVATKSTFRFRLAGYPDCHVGAVRLYLNGRYKAAFDDQGLLTLEVPAGNYEIEVWDSGGHWITTRNISSDQDMEVVFTCSSKIAMDADQ